MPYPLSRAASFHLVALSDDRSSRATAQKPELRNLVSSTEPEKSANHEKFWRPWNPLRTAIAPCSSTTWCEQYAVYSYWEKPKLLNVEFNDSCCFDFLLQFAVWMQINVEFRAMISCDPIEWSLADANSFLESAYDMLLSLEQFYRFEGLHWDFQ